MTGGVWHLETAEGHRHRLSSSSQAAAPHRPLVAAKSAAKSQWLRVHTRASTKRTCPSVVASIRRSGRAR